MKVTNTTRNRPLGASVGTASGVFARMRGLLGTDGLPAGGGLWISPCRAIHSIGMRYAFDALFLDAAMRVVGAYAGFPPNRISRVFPSARGVLELPGGTIGRTGTQVGDLVAFQGEAEGPSAARPRRPIF